MTKHYRHDGAGGCGLLMIGGAVVLLIAVLVVLHYAGIFL